MILNLLLGEYEITFVSLLFSKMKKGNIQHIRNIIIVSISSVKFQGPLKDPGLLNKKCYRELQRLFFKSELECTVLKGTYT